MGRRSDERAWRMARAVSLAGVAALLAGLAIRPGFTLPLFWNVVFPIIPATLLVSPLLWRNVCPIATLNMWASDDSVVRIPGTAGQNASRSLGIVLLVVLVPARHIALNHQAWALAGLTALLAVAAVVGGRRFAVRSGFCNAWCPILPVERLYGQSPLIDVDTDRCSTCTACTRGCIDVSPTKSINQVLGRTRHSAAWLLTPFGAFAAGFPGLVVGYFVTSDGPLATAPIVYGTVLGAVAVSFALVALVVTTFDLSPKRTLPLLGGLAVGLYYWFAVTGLTQTLGLPAGSEVALRTVALALVGTWLARALYRLA